ncbi:MAG: cardiolipin synthase [Kiritimatiellia bacterium]|jgi:cardiolipin synthase (CMP-forming)
MTAGDTHLPQITLATRVTIVRILGIPVFVLLMLYYFLSIRNGQPEESYRLASLVCFILIIATDALDGYLARSRDEVSRLGQILDPIADKLLVLSALVLLTRPYQEAFQPQLPLWFATLLISRDIFIVAGCLVIQSVKHKVEVRPRWSGKLSTFLVAGTIALVLLPAPQIVINGFLITSGICITISWFQYLQDGMKQLHTP